MIARLDIIPGFDDPLTVMICVCLVAFAVVFLAWQYFNEGSGQ
jgi:hypothetical protein